MEPVKSWLEKAKAPSSSSAKAASRADQFIRERANQCFVVRGQDSTGRDAVYVVLIDQPKLKAFQKHQIGDTYNLEDYGKIVYSCYGHTIPAHVQQMLTEKYGFDNLGEPH